MKPFSPLCYIKNNLKRAITLILLISTVGFCYLGGLYISSATDNYIYMYDSAKDYYMFYERNNEGAVNEFDNAYKDIEQSDAIGKIIYTNWNSSFICENIMGLNYYVEVVAFTSTENFEYFNKVTKSVPENIKLNPGEIVITDKLATMFDLKIGDTITPDTDKDKYNFFETYTVKAIVEDKSYISFAISNNNHGSTPLAIRKITENESKEQIEKARHDMDVIFKNLYDKYPNMTFKSHERLVNDVKDIFEMFYLIYYAICFVVTLVIAVTLNAIFVGAYNKRKFEFSVYKAIGFSKREISKKIISEILLINFFGLISAAILTVLSLLIINVIILYPQGMWMNYFHKTSMIVAMLCDIAIIVPVIFFRLRKIKKYDVTEY